MRYGVALCLSCLLFMSSVVLVQGAAEEKITNDARCSVCGMFVARHQNWAAQIRLDDGKVLFFDGVKDLMVFYHHPEKYGKFSAQNITEVWVKDYYKQQWIDGKKALYVIGSTVMGPMGKELIPFASQDAAKTFMTDHKGQKIVAFNEITDALVQALRSNMKMMHGSM